MSTEMEIDYVSGHAKPINQTEGSLPKVCTQEYLKLPPTSFSPLVTRNGLSQCEPKCDRNVASSKNVNQVRDLQSFLIPPIFFCAKGGKGRFPYHSVHTAGTAYHTPKSILQM